VRLTRKQFVAGGAGALAAAGIYGLVDRFTGSDSAATRVLPSEQHVLGKLEIVVDNGVEVVVPPLHHEVVTARIAGGDLRDAKRRLEAALQELEDRYPSTPKGLGVTVAYGLPYFRTHVPGTAAKHLPYDRRAQKPALLDARTFPSDPPGTILEQNDVAVLMRSDHLDHIADAHKLLFDRLAVFEPTSIRRGFVGGDLPRKMAQAAGVPGADLVPEKSELFLGFTSTQKAGLGPRLIVNHETLGYVDLRTGYFRGGTHMHLSHIAEDLEAWYLNFDFNERVSTAFRPGLRVAPGVQTVHQGPDDAATRKQVDEQFRRSGNFGHSASIQLTSRLQMDHVAEDGTVYRKGTAIPQRADFNTLDNPFAWTAHPGRDGYSEQPAAGVHFVVFNPSSDDFHRNRLAMDGVLPDGTRLQLPPRARGQGFNSILRTTHRQNFLVPPRRHRAFPLAELA
jgi:hypothetical protein